LSNVFFVLFIGQFDKKKYKKDMLAEGDYKTLA